MRRNTALLRVDGAPASLVQHPFVVKFGGGAMLERGELVLARGLLVLAARRMEGI